MRQDITSRSSTNGSKWKLTALTPHMTSHLNSSRTGISFKLKVKTPWLFKKLLMPLTFRSMQKESPYRQKRKKRKKQPEEKEQRWRK
jgi:hypothetical protein